MPVSGVARVIGLYLFCLLWLKCSRNWSISSCLTTYGRTLYFISHNLDVLISWVNAWMKALEKDLLLGSVILDPTKAFECVDHDILSQKLQGKLLGFQGILRKELERIQNYGMRITLSKPPGHQVLSFN